MTTGETVIAGTLLPDGTLVLDEKPILPAGRVTVRMQPMSGLPVDDPFFAMLQGIWDVRSKAGLTPRSVEEVESLRRQLRDESESEVLAAGKLQAECRALKHEVRE